MVPAGGPPSAPHTARAPRGSDDGDDGYDISDDDNGDQCLLTTGGGREEGGRAQGNNEASVRSAQPMVAVTTVAMEAWKRWQRRQERKLSCKICVRSRSLQLPSPGVKDGAEQHHQHK